MIDNAQAQRTDADRIESIVTAIREKYPTAVRFGVSSSDQGSGGYNLIDVGFDDGSIVDSDSGEFAQLADDLWEDAIWLRWGAFGDQDENGMFDVDMTTRKMVRLDPCPDCGYVKYHTQRCARN